MANKLLRLNTFGSHLLEFARSIDIVNKSTFDTARQLVSEYLYDQFDAIYIELSIARLVNGVAGLSTLWSGADQDLSNTVKDVNEAYTSQAALCYDQNKPLWIVNTEKRKLQAATNSRDLWSKVTDLPPYQSPIATPLFTSVHLPIRRPSNRILGVMTIESGKYHDIADFEPQEFLVLADALGVLYDLYKLHEIQERGTSDAITQLRDIKSSARRPGLAKPQVFVSYSEDADQRVVGIFLEVVRNLGGQFRIVTWKDLDASGQISPQIDDAISTSAFGICYLSEPINQGRYQDNDNVLIEVGMLRGREAAQEEAMYLLIREKNSPTCPFNISGERIEYVPRIMAGVDESNEMVVNEPLFRADLESKLQWLMANT